MKISANKLAFVSVCAMVISLTAIESKKDDELKAIKNEIMTKDPARYDKLIKDEQENGDISLIWEGERDLMADSLRIEGIAKQVYFQASQMMKDSLKNSQ